MQPTLNFFQGLLYDLSVHSNSAPLHALLQPMTCGDQHPSVIPRINSAFMPRFQLADVVNSPRKSKSWAPLIRLLRSPNHLQKGTNVNGLLATILHFHGPKGIIIYILTGLLYFSPARYEGQHMILYRLLSNKSGCAHSIVNSLRCGNSDLVIPTAASSHFLAFLRSQTDGIIISEQTPKHAKHVGLCSLLPQVWKDRKEPILSNFHMTRVPLAFLWISHTRLQHPSGPSI